MSAASTSLDDGSTTSSDGGGYLGIARGQEQYLGGKTMVGGKNIKSMGEDSSDNDSDNENNQNEESSSEEQSFEVDDEETEEEDGVFQQPKAPLANEKAPKQRIEVNKSISQAPGTDEGQQSQIEAWKEVHASLTKAVLVAREAIASKKLQRRFWLETICANLSHPSEAKTSTATSQSSSPPSQMPLLMSHSVWFKPDQRKKKRGSKKQSLGTTSEDLPKAKTARKTKATAISNKTTLASLSGTKKKVAKGSSLLKKRKLATLPLKGKTKAATSLATGKKRATAALPTKGGVTAKPKMRLVLDSSKTVPPEAKASVSVLSVFQDDSDDESENSRGEEAVAMDLGNDDESDNAEEKEEEDRKSASFFAFASNADDDTSSEEENDAVKAEIQDSEEDDGQANSSDNDGPDWNASQSSHPFLKKRRSSLNNSAQGNLDSSEIYSTFRPGDQNEEKEDKGEAEATSNRMMSAMSGYGPFGGSDSSEDEIPF